jgi:ferredoxin-NADP reductase
VSDTLPPRRIKRGWMNLRVDRIIRETHDTDTFVLVDADEGGRPFDYVAGQYLTFRFDDIAEKPIVRSYTMSSSPCEPDYSAFTVKRVEGGKISNWLCDNVKVGTILRARGPIGKFVFDPSKDKEHLVMVAGGSGVTPFISIMREYATRLGAQGAPKQMTLVVSYRSRADLICNKDLEMLRKVANVRLIVTLSREDASKDGYWHGRITDDLLAKALTGTYGNATYMTCGPQAIMDMAVSHLKSHGVTDEHVKLESFES